MITYKKENGYPADIEFKTTEGNGHYQTDVFVNGEFGQTLYFLTDNYSVGIKKYVQGFFDGIEWKEKENKKEK